MLCIGRSVRSESSFGKYSFAYFLLSIKGLICYSKEADLARTDIFWQWFENFVRICFFFVLSKRECLLMDRATCGLKLTTCILLFAAVRSRYGKTRAVSILKRKFLPSLLFIGGILQGIALFEVAMQKDLVLRVSKRKIHSTIRLQKPSLLLYTYSSSLTMTNKCVANLACSGIKSIKFPATKEA